MDATSACSRLLSASVLFITAPAFAEGDPPQGVSAADWAAVRAAHTSAGHAVAATANGHVAQNPGQGYTTRFDGRGFVTQPSNGAWQFGLELASHGWGERQRVANAPRATVVDGQRCAYEWDANLTEWFVNEPGGLEHGFTLAARADAGDEPLSLELSVRGGLVPRVAANGRDVAFLAHDGTVAVDYAGLCVFDADGDRFAAHFETTPNGLRLEVDDRGADYPLTIDPVVRAGYLKASNPDGLDAFGHAVAVHGDTLVVGAYREDSAATGVNGNGLDDTLSAAGAAYVFVRSGSTWVQQAYLKASNTDEGDEFGYAVAVHGDTVVVSAPGESSNATGIGGDQSSDSANSSGAVYVFERTGGTWAQTAYIKAAVIDPVDRFGEALDFDGETLVVSAPFEDSAAVGVNGDPNDDSLEFAGAVYVFVRSAGSWSQEAYLKASNTDGGDGFGLALAVSGDTLVVGAQRERSSAAGVNGDQFNNLLDFAGAAYVFVRDSGTWSQEAYLKASNTDQRDFFGTTVDVSGDTVVVGAYGESSDATGIGGDEGSNAAGSAGAVYVFARNGTTWAQQAYVKASNTEALDVFGAAVTLDGDTLVVGAVLEDSAAAGVDGDQSSNAALDSGAAYVFVRNGTTWSQQSYVKAQNTDASDRFGLPIAIDGDTVVIGARYEDSAASGVNGDASNDDLESSGAAYVFDVRYFDVVPGCLVNTATFDEPTGAARVGTTTTVALHGGAVTNGVFATYFGAKGVDASGCGQLLSPTLEVLLAAAPVPSLLGFGNLVGGDGLASVTVPSNPSLAGVLVTLQSVVVDPLTFATEFSNGLEIEIRP